MKENKFKKWYSEEDRKEIKEKRRIIKNLYSFGLNTHYINVILFLCFGLGFLLNYSILICICGFLLWFNSWIFLVKVENYANKRG